MGHSGEDAVHKKSSKMKTQWPNRLNLWYWLILKFSLEQDTKRQMLYLSNAPLSLSFEEWKILRVTCK